jgi:hypothetical protein
VSAYCEPFVSSLINEAHLGCDFLIFFVLITGLLSTSSGETLRSELEVLSLIFVCYAAVLISGLAAALWLETGSVSSRRRHVHGYTQTCAGTHALTQSHSCAHSLTRTHTRSGDTKIHSFTHTLARAHTYMHAQTRAHAGTHTQHTHALHAHVHTHTCARAETLAHTYTCTHTYSRTHTLPSPHPCPGTSRCAPSTHIHTNKHRHTLAHARARTRTHARTASSHTQGALGEVLAYRPQRSARSRVEHRLGSQEASIYRCAQPRQWP